MSEYQQISDAPVAVAAYAAAPPPGYQQNVFYNNQEMPFEGETVFQGFRLADADNYNHLVLSSHRVIFETKRVTGSNSYLLSNSTFNGCLLALLQLLWAIVQFIIFVFTFGTEPDSLVRDSNILLKDVNEIRLFRVRSSELANHAKLLLTLNLLCVIFICISTVWPTGAIIFVFVDILALFSLIFIGRRILLNAADLMANRTKQVQIVVLGVTFCFFVVYWSCALAFLFGNPTIGALAASGVFGWLCVLASGAFLRLVYEDKVVKGIISITGRKSSVVMALSWEDAVAAKNAIWKLRKDIKKLE